MFSISSMGIRSYKSMLSHSTSMLSSEAEPDGEGGGGMPFKAWQLMEMLDQLSDDYESGDVEAVL